MPSPGLILNLCKKELVYLTFGFNFPSLFIGTFHLESSHSLNDGWKDVGESFTALVIVAKLVCVYAASDLAEK